MSILRSLFFLVICIRVSAEPVIQAPLTNAVDVLSLPGNRAWGIPVLIRGIVTAAEPVTPSRPDWEGKFFVQDETAGIFAEDSSHQRPMPGDLVEVSGTSHPGGFAPFISYASWTKLGTAPLPEAKPVPIEQLMAGIEDSQRVEITGIIRAVREQTPLLVTYELASGGFRLSVYVPPLPRIDPSSLIGARVRVRGTASTFFSAQLRQLITVELHVPFPSDFIVEKAQPADPFTAPVLPLNSLGQYRRGRELGEKVHVKGVVTYQRPGKDLFIRDATSGLHIKTRQPGTLAIGTEVEAAGFLNFDHFLPVLEDASFRETQASRAALEPQPVAIWELQAGYRHADLITLGGKVLDRIERQSSDKDGGKVEHRTMLTLQNSDVVFTVEGSTPGINQALGMIPIESTVEVDGICFMNIANDGKLQSLQLLLPDANGVRILQKPNWLTAPRLLTGLSILSVILIASLIWIAMVQKRNLALKVLIREKVRAQEELQQSHDLLEWRVAERTKQLKIEMTARNEAEVQFKATLAERTRLAQELHDTLEQSLMGIGLQFDSATRLIEKDPAAGCRHLGLARNLMTQTQLELRRSIWDLRSRELEQFDFPSALRINAQRIAEGADLKLEVETSGEARALPEVTEENLLRISQAALTNVIKHANATQVKIKLQFDDDSVTLRIADNGHGFNPEKCPGLTDGHFGLTGIAERAKRLEGHLQVTSTGEKGTCLEVRIPTKPSNTKIIRATAQTSEPV